MSKLNKLALRLGLSSGGGAGNSLVMTNQTIAFDAVENDDVGQTVMRVAGATVTHVTTHDGVTIEGPTAVTLDSLTVDANVAQGTVVANIGATGGTAPFAFTELTPLSAELIIVGTELQTTQLLVGGDDFDITIGVTDAEGLSYLLQPAFTIDVTDIAAVLTIPTGTQTGETTADGSVDTDLPYDELFWIVSDDVTKPSVPEIRLGQEAGGGAADASGDQLVTAAGTENVSATGLVENTTYFFHYMQDTVLNLASNIPTSASFKTAATVAVLSLPTGVETGDTTADGTVSTTYDDGILYFQATTSATSPSLATMRAGTNQAVTATGVQNVSVTGLDPETTYFMHFMHDNDDVVASNQVVSASFQTDAAGAGAVVDFDFTTMTPAEAATNLTWVRASAATSIKVDGTVVKFATGIDKITDKGILTEEANTNLLLRSEDFSNAAWAKTSVTVESTSTTMPDDTAGTTNTVTISAGAHELSQDFTVVASTNYVLTFWARRGTSTAAQVSVRDLSNVADIIAAETYFSEINGTTWTRVLRAFTTPSGCTSVRIYPLRDGGVAGTMELWGTQNELDLGASTATSYIPTVGSTVTRAADLVQITDATDIVNTTGTFFTDVTEVFNQDTQTRIVAGEFTNDRVFYRPSDTSTGTHDNNGNILTATLGSGSHSVQSKNALAYNGTGRSLVANDGTVVSDANNLSNNGFDEIYLGMQSVGTRQINGFMKAFQWYDTKLSDAEIGTLTEL